MRQFSNFIHADLLPDRNKLLKVIAALFFLVVAATVVADVNFRLFHCGVELFIAVVAASVFVIAWNGRRYMDNGFYQLLGVSCLFIAFFHGMHLLAYKGVEVVGRGADTATQLWIATRYLTAATFVAAPLLASRRLNVYGVFAGYAVVSGLLLLSILQWNVFPACFVEGQGLTLFKKSSEYVISAFFMLSMWLLWRNRSGVYRNVFWPFMAAVATGIAGEIAFTLYTDVTGAFNIAGHLLVLSSFGLIYQGLVEATLRRPYDTLFRDLARSEERYRGLVEMSPEAIFINRNDRIDFVNTAGLRLFNAQQPSDLLGRSPFELFHPECHAIIRERIALLEQGETVPLIEERIVQLTGDVRTVEVTASLVVGRDGATAIQVILRDITDRKHAQLERDITIAFLRLVNDTSALQDLIHAAVEFFSEQSGCEAVGIRLKEDDDYPYYGVTGFSREFVHAESSLCSSCGGGEPPRDESGYPLLDCLCGCVIRGLCDPSQPFYTPAGSFWTNSTSDLIAKTDPAALPCRIRNTCNAQGYESVALIPLQCGDERMGLLQLNDRRRSLFTPRALALWERLAGYLAVALAKANAEQALRLSAASLARSNRDLEQFAYVASHDLQEPLRQISGFVRLLNRDYSPMFDQTAREFFDFIEEGTLRMQSLINDLLQYSRVGRNRAMTSVDLNETLRSASQNLQARIAETGAEIKCWGLPSVRENGMLLTQVFQNLLANSLKFRGERRPEIVIDARQHDGEWLVAVKDNGIGFRQDHAEKIFMVFQRLHRRSAYEGTGIGLAICKRAIEEHGGRIWAEAKPNEGATFYFTLPASSL